MKKILVHAFEITLKTNIHFEGRKRVLRKLTISKLLYIVRCQRRKKISSFLTSDNHCQEPSFHIGMGSSPLTRKFHDEHHNRLEHYSANESCAQLLWLHIQFEVTWLWHPKSLFLNVPLGLLTHLINWVMLRPVATFLTPFFWMNLPSKFIHKPKTCLSGS